jgi:hypothetical protein
MAFLTISEQKNQTSKKLVDYWQNRLSILQKKLENELDLVETTNLRGKISEIRHNLSLLQGDPLGPTDIPKSVDYY